MSHMTTLELEMTSMKYLEKALKAMGHEVSTTKKTVSVGSRTENVDISLVDEHTIGFKQVDGKISFVGDFYYSKSSKKVFMRELENQYSLAMVTDKLKKRGLRVRSEKLVGNTIEVTFA